MQTDKIFKLEEPDERILSMGKSMALAFRGEPNITYAWPKVNKQIQPLNWIFGSFLPRVGLQVGEVYTTPGFKGGAIWQRPNTGITVQSAIRAGMISSPFYLGLQGLYRWTNLGKHVEQTRKKVAPSEHWYLFAVGVKPSMQGRGTGKALLKPVLEKADRAQTPCYLETFSETTVPFYQKLNFEVIHCNTVPHGPKYWCMIH